MKCPKCGHILMESYSKGQTKNNKKIILICADLFCHTAVEWDAVKYGEYNGGN